MTTESILIDADAPTLAAAVEENLFALFRVMAATLPGGELIERESLSYHLTFPSNPMFKGVWHTRLSAENVDRVIDETIAWFETRQAPFLFWWTGPGTSPADLGERLEARGLISMAEQTRQVAPGLKAALEGAPGMVADLHQMNEAAVSRVLPGFTIDRVTSETDLYDFKQVVLESYDIPDWAGQAWVDATLSVGIDRAPWLMYLGRLDGAPVATNMLFNGAGVASVYAVGTIPSARRQGLGGAITLKPLLDARRMGYRYAVLFSSEMGLTTYERLGFQACGIRINRYLWRKES